MSRPAPRARAGAARSIVVASLLALPVGLAWSAFPAAAPVAAPATGARTASGSAAALRGHVGAAPAGWSAGRCLGPADAVAPADLAGPLRVVDRTSTPDRPVAERPRC